MKTCSILTFHLGTETNDLFEKHRKKIACYIPIKKKEINNFITFLE